VREDGVAAVVGTGQSTVALLASETAEKLQVPFVVSAAAADDITQRGLTYTFRLCPPADWYARDQVAFLQALKLKGTEVSAVALLHERGEFGRRTAESEIAYLAQAGIAVVADIEYSASQADVHDEILRIKQSGAQALLTATLLSDAALIADDLAVLHVNIPMVDAAGGVLDPAFIGQAGFAAENVMSVAECAQGIVPSRDLQPEAQGSGETIEADALYGYQAVVLLASALERAGAAGGAEIRDALALTALSGDELVLPQDVLTFDQTGQNQGARLLVVQVQDGRLVPVWPHQYAQAAVRLP
jgi:branched-chain amino acid transport system substrate-binding protein